MKAKKKQSSYLKAIKKADRELELQNGWKAKDKPHKNKKKYNRKDFKIEDCL